MKIELTEHVEIESAHKPAKFELLEIDPVKDWLMSCETEDCKQCRKSDFTRTLWIILLMFAWIRSIRQGLDTCRKNSSSSG